MALNMFSRINTMLFFSHVNYTPEISFFVCLPIYCFPRLNTAPLASSDLDHREATSPLWTVWPKKATPT